MRASLGWSSKADGSCLLEDDDDDDADVAADDRSSVLVTVNGPAPVKARSELVDRATVQVTFASLNYPPGGESDVWANKLEQLLQGVIILTEENPRSLYQIAIQPLNVGRRFLSAAVNAMFMALLDAGVPMKRSFVAVSDDHGLAIVDPATHQCLFEESEGAFVRVDSAAVVGQFERIRSFLVAVE